MRVYCCNCKYHKDTYCRLLRTINRTAINVELFNGDCFKLNENNDCINFKKETFIEKILKIIF